MMYIASAGALLLFLLIVGFIIYKRKEGKAYALRRQQYQSIDDALMERFEAAKKSGDEAVAAFGKYISDAVEAKERVARAANRTLLSGEVAYIGLREAVQTATNAARKARRELEEATLTAEWREKYQLGTSLTNSEELAERLQALGQFEDNPERTERADIDVDALKKELLAALIAWFQPLWEKIAIDKSAFDELHSFVADQWWNLYDKYLSKASCNAYEKVGFIPAFEGWNDAVARHLEMPSLSDFTGTYPDKPKGYVLRTAATALRTRSLTSAKIVLAYCKFHQRYIQEVGPLRQQLAVMVGELESSR